MKKALIIIDIQNDYFESEKGLNPLFESEKASKNARLVLKKFRESHDLVIHIQHLSTRDGATFFVPNTKGAEIHSDVKPLDNEKVIIKHFPNSFRDTELLDYLKENEVEHLVICGMMTHMCVDATVRAAKDYGYTIQLISDACATKDLEIFGKEVKAYDVQKSFLAAMNYFYSVVTTTGEYI